MYLSVCTDASIALLQSYFVYVLTFFKYSHIKATFSSIQGCRQAGKSFSIWAAPALLALKQFVCRLEKQRCHLEEKYGHWVWGQDTCDKRLLWGPYKRCKMQICGSSGQSLKCNMSIGKKTFFALPGGVTRLLYCDKWKHTLQCFFSSVGARKLIYRLHLCASFGMLMVSLRFVDTHGMKHLKILISRQRRVFM